MWIINQDQDAKYFFDRDEEDTLYCLPKLYKGNVIAFNLMLNGELLGTFDTITEAMEEMANIVQCEEEEYQVFGFSDYTLEGDFV